jgi:hypothetical protein
LEEQSTSNNKKKWLKKLGIAGFLFFFIKGLVWIGVFVFAAKSCG